MANLPTGMRFSASHEWARREDDGTITVGISDHAQAQLGDLVFVDLPDVGRELAAKEPCAVVESVKAASDVYAPVSGTVVAINDALADAPEAVNQSAFADGWLFRVQPPSDADFDALLTGDGYAALIA